MQIGCRYAPGTIAGQVLNDRQPRDYIQSIDVAYLVFRHDAINR